MPKTINLPNAVYKDLEAVTEELSALAKKPISISMTVYLLVEIYRAHVRDPCAKDVLRRNLASSNLLTPREFEEACDEFPQKTNGVKSKQDVF